MSRYLFDLYSRQFKKNPEKFWKKIADYFIWDKPYKKLHKRNKKGPGRWFFGGKINYSVNILEEKIKKGLGDKEILAIYKKNGKKKTYTYEQLLGRIKKISFFLHKKGIKKNKKILILLYKEDKELSILLSLALQRLGAHFGFLYAGFPEKTIHYYLKKTKTEFLIYDESILDNAGNFFKLEIIEKKELIKNKPPKYFSKKISFDPDKPRFFVFTSRTTALPKAIFTGGLGFFFSIVLVEKLLMGLNKKSSFFITLHFAFGPTIALYYAALFLESKIVVCEKKNFLASSQFRKIIKAEKVNALAITPVFLDKVKHKINKPLKIASTGQAIDKTRWKICKKYFPNSKMINIYGLAETMACFSTLAVDIKKSSLDKVNSLLLFPGIDYKIAGKDKKGCGRLMIKNFLPSLCRSYFGNRRKFLARFKKGNDLFDTKDLATEKNKYIKIRGRSDFLLKIKGRFLDSLLVEREVKKSIMPKFWFLKINYIYV